MVVSRSNTSWVHPDPHKHRGQGIEVARVPASTQPELSREGDTNPGGSVACTLTRAVTHTNNENTRADNRKHTQRRTRLHAHPRGQHRRPTHINAVTDPQRQTARTWAEHTLVLSGLQSEAGAHSFEARTLASVETQTHTSRGIWGEAVRGHLWSGGAQAVALQIWCEAANT